VVADDEAGECRVAAGQGGGGAEAAAVRGCHCAAGRLDEPRTYPATGLGAERNLFTVPSSAADRTGLGR
jgi:hypothetical protein